MKLTFDTQNIDTIEVEGDHIYVYFIGALAVCVNKYFFDHWLRDIQYCTEQDIDYIYNNKFEEYIKEYLEYQVERQVKYS